MKHLKKKTIALVLASVVTVVGSFAANNYRNSLMGLSFETTPSGNVSMAVQTKTAYSGNVTPIRKDANTFILMLPEVNSLAPTPDLSNAGNISSVNIRTMPYSSTAKGYTRITIKTTTPSLVLSGHNQIFIGDSTSSEKPTEETYSKSATEDTRDSSQEEALRRRQLEQQEQERELMQRDARLKEESELQRNDSLVEEQSYSDRASDSSNFVEQQEEDEDLYSEEKVVETDSDEHSYYILWAILIILGCVFFYIKAKNKMAEIAGEKLEIDVDEEEKPKPQKKVQKNLSKIKNTIKTLDNAYSKTTGLLDKTEYTQSQLQQPVKKMKPAEELNVVDLDKLFEEQKAKPQEEQDEENAALEEFLSGFSFDEEFYVTEQQEDSVGYDEEFYKKVINNENIAFSKDDMSCIKKLLASEILDDTMRNIDNYAVTNPIKAPSKQKILEDLVTTYTISQNISFTRDDIDALYKIINVEIDKDFVMDLRTNPNRVAEMQRDISEYGDKPKKPSEIITLSVSEMLPDLSEALRKQGDRKIESEHKPETIYFSEGYDVKTLSLTDELPDLTKELNKKDAFMSKPSATYDIVDSSYTVGNSELKISFDLPDLQDALANPEKYNKSEETEVIVDEQALLNNISNVQFKPFDDGTRDFEVLNTFEDVPSVDDIQKELNQFGGFEITKDEQNLLQVSNEYKGSNDIDNDEVFVDLDKEISLKENKEFVPLKLDREVKPKQRERRGLPENIINKINASREKRKAVSVEKEQKIQDANIPTKCLLDGESFVVVSSVSLADNIGCYLAKNENGYAVVGYVADALTKIKEYSELKSEKIQARLSEKLANGTQRFLIRIGVNKFIVDVSGDQVCYVMDLC